MAESPGIDERAGALFGLDLDEFTAARNQLAKALKAEGHKAEAAVVAKLRKPTVTAWALNQLSRTRSELVDAVLGAGLALRKAMTQAVGGDRSALRAAEANERRAVDAAVAAAVQILEGAGRGGGDAASQRMAATLRSAVLDPSVADEIRRGVLPVDRAISGFGVDPDEVEAALPTGEGAPTPDEREAQERAAKRASLDADAARLEERARRLADAADAAERRALEARAAADRADAEAKAAREAADAAGD